MAASAAEGLRDLETEISVQLKQGSIDKGFVELFKLRALTLIAQGLDEIRDELETMRINGMPRL